MNLKKNPELIPLIEWWEKDGKQIVLILAVALVAFGGWKYWQYHRASVKQAASESFVSAYTTEEIEDAVGRYGGEDAAGVLKLRLAKSSFDSGSYETALATYEELIAQNAPEGLQDIPVVGKAQCLEALGRFDEAQKAFDAYATNEANTNSYQKLTAQLGVARCLAEGGDKAKALAYVDELAKAVKDDDIAKARIETTKDVITRFGRKAPAAEVAKPVAEAEKPAAEAEKPAAEAEKPAEPTK